MLGRWHYFFDLATELLRFIHIQVLFPYLTLYLWNCEALTVIGNHLGSFIHLEDGLLHGVDRRVGNILVEIDMNKGF